jgi:hypothetical protein
MHGDIRKKKGGGTLKYRKALALVIDDIEEVPRWELRAPWESLNRRPSAVYRTFHTLTSTFHPLNAEAPKIPAIPVADTDNGLWRQQGDQYYCGQK